MTSLIVVHPTFEATWPFVADELHTLFAAQGPIELMRLKDGDRRALGRIVAQPAGVTRLIALGVPVTPECLVSFAELREAAFQEAYRPVFEDTTWLAAHDVRVYTQPNE